MIKPSEQKNISSKILMVFAGLKQNIFPDNKLFFGPFFVLHPPPTSGTKTQGKMAGFNLLSMTCASSFLMGSKCTGTIFDGFFRRKLLVIQHFFEDGYKKIVWI